MKKNNNAQTVRIALPAVEVPVDTLCHILAGYTCPVAGEGETRVKYQADEIIKSQVKEALVSALIEAALTLEH